MKEHTRKIFVPPQDRITIKSQEYIEKTSNIVQKNITTTSRAEKIQNMFKKVKYCAEKNDTLWRKILNTYRKNMKLSAEKY